MRKQYASTELHDHLGNVEKHKKWANNNNDKVFWFLVPPADAKFLGNIKLMLQRDIFIFQELGKFSTNF